MKNLLNILNDQQLDSVITTDVPVRIIAGPGSGKTRVVTTKIAYLVKQENIAPYKILAVTFTNKAANEMKERVEKMIGPGSDKPFISTFHSFCVRVLREDFEHCNLKKDFVIIDTSDQAKIFRNIIKELNIDIDDKSFTRKCASKISGWKNHFIDWEEARESLYTHQEKHFATIYREYLKYLENKNLLDFDDLILKVHTLFRTNTEIRTKWKNRFDYILVDEFQDTNDIQFNLIQWLLGDRNCLTVVGDPDQTIYSWRGAKLRIIMNFEQVYPKARTILLTQNYRSTKPIVDLANNFIIKNKNREDKEIYTLKTEGSRVSIKEASSTNFEAKFVAKKIQELVKSKQYEYKDIYVIFRINAWSQEIEKEFANAKIPFSLVGGYQFRERKVIKDATALLKAISIKDDLSFERIFDFTPKVGSVTSGKLFAAAKEMNLNMFDFLTQHENKVKEITKNLDSLIITLKTGNEMFMENTKLATLAKAMIKLSGYEDKINSQSKEDLESLQNLRAYYDQFQKFDEEYDLEKPEINRLIKFLQEESLSSSSETPEVPNKVTLLTIHAAKGLENKVVFIVGLNKDIFPSKRAFTSMENLEEERRAFYVAITRAQEMLFISYVSGGFSYLVGGELGESRFIRELDPSLYDFEKNIYFHSPTEMTSQMYSTGLVHKEPTKIESGVFKGDKVDHIMFGEGIVTSITDKYLVIAFSNPSYGTKSIPIVSKSWSKK